MEDSNVEFEGFSEQKINMDDEPEQRGLTLRGKFFVTCMVISSFPVIIPSLVTLSALGVMFSIPIGLFLAGYSFTDNIIRKIFCSSKPCLKGRVESNMIAPKESLIGDSPLSDTEETGRWETSEVEAGKGCNDGRVIYHEVNGSMNMDEIKECCLIEMAKSRIQSEKSEGLGELSIPNIKCQNGHREDHSCTREEKQDDLFAEDEGPSSGDKVDCFGSTLENNTMEITAEGSINGCHSSSIAHLFDVEAEHNARRKELEEKLSLVQTVLGCRTGCESTNQERLNALFSIVGVTESTPSDGSTGISELEEKLRYLMSVVGVE